MTASITPAQPRAGSAFRFTGTIADATATRFHSSGLFIDLAHHPPLASLSLMRCDRRLLQDAVLLTQATAIPKADFVAAFGESAAPCDR